jgi:hypothetical protein
MIYPFVGVWGNVREFFLANQSATGLPNFEVL